MELRPVVARVRVFYFLHFLIFGLDTFPGTWPNTGIRNRHTSAQTRHAATSTSPLALARFIFLPRARCQAVDSGLVACPGRLRRQPATHPDRRRAANTSSRRTRQLSGPNPIRSSGSLSEIGREHV